MARSPPDLHSWEESVVLREFDGTAPIPHALQLSLPAGIVGNSAAWPASHHDGSCGSTSCLPEGALVQLDPAYNIDASSYPAWKKKILRALQTYGGYVADRGGTVEIRAETRFDDSVWTSRGIGIGAALDDLPWSRMRILEITPGPGTVPLVDGRLRISGGESRENPKIGRLAVGTSTGLPGRGDAVHGVPARQDRDRAARDNEDDESRCRP